MGLRFTLTIEDGSDEAITLVGSLVSIQMGPSDEHKTLFSALGHFATDEEVEALTHILTQQEGQRIASRRHRGR